MAKKSFLSFIYDQFSTVPAVAKADLRGKTVVVVGANTGLGFEATQHFARMDPGRLILACRSQEKGEAAIQRRSISHLTCYKQVTDMHCCARRFEENNGVLQS